MWNTFTKSFNSVIDGVKVQLERKRNIYQEGELAEEVTCKDFLQVQTEGSRQIRRNRRFYNLDAKG
jgi:hypothetical protein